MLFRSTLHRYVVLYNQQLPQSALGSKTPLQAMKDWHKLKPGLFKKQPYHLPGCDNCPIPDVCIDERRLPLFIARATLRELIAGLKARATGGAAQ